ncbi:hypothetical protein N7491_001573 [Penicillium cf. griseofulvum]|uniref:TLC domain-containing protein n=1 Tax=Penicillium cf. griseofulvum TaxID=2972120 RepID=A0A9W9JDI7_9EURO|nr:hypothetical protein N7472_006703 [Penicillium cf. griseofulvum]KAJ5445491.1 hypothetical protein N7491_001573 [Penicillium cf. griseofulvum]KAJ5447211.1 hypothetical protein N7445_002032 [Penicillium cf. griseofulvum]
MVLTHHHHPVPLATKELGPISILAPFSALIISIILTILFLVRFYVLEGFLIRRLYGPIYTRMSDLNRRGFINHHIAGVTKAIILIVAAYPFISVAFCRGPVFSTPFAPGSVVTLGDILIVVAQMLIGIYIFELIYRVKLSPVAVMHHIGTIIIGQTAIAISLPPLHESDAYIEFVLCTVWGAFDAVFELFPHVAIVLYRIFPDRHRLLSNVFLFSCFTTALGTVIETVVTMWLFASTWNRWRLALKIVTPLLHVAFSAAQIHGSLVFWRMYCRQKRFQMEADIEARECEKGEREDSVNDRQSEGHSVDGENDFGLVSVKSGVPIVDAVERSS